LLDSMLETRAPKIVRVPGDLTQALV